MNIEELKHGVEEFDKKLGWNKTEIKEIINFMQEELDNLKAGGYNRERIDHLLTDLLMLVMQAGYKNQTDFKKEIEKWFIETEKTIIK
ncbi:MAG: hypothetical protein WCW77_05180 [Patescibacteria group bacterium]|jgi:hypothetical protein